MQEPMEKPMQEPEERRARAQRAIEEGRHADLRALLREDPSLAEAGTDQGQPLVLLACYRHDQESLDALLGVGPTLDVHAAVAVGDLPRVRELLEEDPERLTAPAPDGFEPLHLACYFGAVEVVRELLERGAPADRPVDTPARLRPLHAAVAGGHAPIVEALLARGIDVDARQAGDFTPLMGAAAAGREDLVDLLLAAGAVPGLRADGRTAADLAEERGHPALAARLRG